MAHIHEVLDSNLHFVIDPVTRVLQIDTEDPDKSSMTVIQYDHNSERVTFEIPRIVDGHDMTLCNVVEVHYLNVSKDGRTQASGAYVVKDLGVKADDENTVVGTWLIAQDGTQIAGTLNFLIRFVCITGNTPDYIWNSAVYQSIAVSSGLNSGEAIAIEYPDIVAQWEARITALEVNGVPGGAVSSEQIETVVEYYLQENPVVRSINGVSPDANGNIDVTGGTVSASIEPGESDIPKVFFGGTLQGSKTEKVVPFHYISKTQNITGYAEIKAQGNSSMLYPKKNQTVKLFKDAACTEKLKVNFKGWGNQNKYCFKANWIDLSHARNVVSARLWNDIVRSRSDYAALPLELRTSPNSGAVDGFPIKVYAAGVYQGRYTLNIPKDKWTFNMDDDLDEHCVLCGENYVSGCFRAAANINGSDWSDEIHDVAPESIKTRWNEVIDFVMNSTDEEFKANLSDYFDVPSLIDYHLYGLASCGLDAYGKNQLYLTYDGRKWIASAYDMDATWGLYWNGSKFVSADYARTSYEDFVSAQSRGDGNLLYIRLERVFDVEMRTRWAELKKGALSIENIINRFERFTDVASAELVKEDYASTTGGGAFTNIPSKDTNNIQQIRAYALARQTWTDSYVSALTGGEQPPEDPETILTSISAIYSGSNVVEGTTVTELTGVVVTAHYSDGTSEIVTDYTLSGNIVEGNNIITVSYGGKSTTITVTAVAKTVPCTGITLSKSTLTFNGEGSETVTATASPTDCTDPITWESNNTGVAIVTGGVVTAIANGNATITAHCGNYSATCFVSVSGIIVPVPCTGVSLDKTTLTFTAEGNQTLTPTVTPTDTTDSVVWSSDNESVATVENGIVTAIFNGSATITARCGNYSAICSVSVSGIIDKTLIYELTEETTLDGVDDYIDTGVSLFAENTDFTIAIAFTGTGKNDARITLLQCVCEQDPWPGVSMDIFPGFGATASVYRFVNINSNVPIDTTKHKVVIWKDTTAKKFYMRWDGDDVIKQVGDNKAIVSTTFALPLQLGCKLLTDGTTRTAFWAGTIHDCKVYSRKLTDSEIVNYLAN